jgi:hypothetical protein
LLGLALAFALLVKHSLAALVPITIVLLIAHALWRRFKYKEHFCRYLGLGLIVLGCCYLVFIGGYAFGVSYIDDDEAVFISEWLNVSANSADAFQEFVVHLPILLPKYYLWGMDLVVNDVRNGRVAFLLGEVSDKGWWYYFPVAFVLKTTLPFLLLTVSGIVWTGWDTIRRRWLDGLFLLIPSLGYLGLTMASHLNIGVRHIMPVFPFFAIMGAYALSAFLNADRLTRWNVPKISVGILTGTIVLIVVTTFPDYTTYFSPLAGGPSNGRHLLSDSNVETGQDVKELATFLKARGETHVEGLFVGSGFLRYYGIENCELPCGGDASGDAEDNSDDGDQTDDDNDADDGSSPDISPMQRSNYMILGAYYLEEIDLKPEQNAIIDQYRSMQPEAVIGNAIFVFRKKSDEQPAIPTN